MFDFSPQALLERGLNIILMLLSLSVHEFAHAWSAWRLGDDTASRQGRLTLNPLAHADPFGTFLLPFLGVPFGWARPVPVNPARFRRGVSMSGGFALTAAAGPIANAVLAVVSGGLFILLARYAPALVEPGAGLRVLLIALVATNVGLALFNLIPVPPLDGSRVVDHFIPQQLRPAWTGFLALAPFLLIAVFFFGGRFISGPVWRAVSMVGDLAVAFARPG